MERLFKVLNEDGTSCNGGHGSWSLPHDGQPGEWMPAIEGELVPCQNGYHLCRESDLIQWLGPAIYEAEYRGERLDADDKIIVREARLLRRLDAWNERTARLFACDCAESALPIYEREYPDDDRPRQAVGVARRYANGEATAEELSAARDAAWAATWDAARAVAWAARDAAWAAAWTASWDAARAVAWAAARAVAWAARDAAWTASWDAARAVAWAARDAAWAAAWDAMTEMLMTYLYPDEQN